MSRENTSGRGRLAWLVRFLAAAAAGGIAVLLLLVLFADALLTIRGPRTEADVIVVLGGDGPRRAAQATRLFGAGVAPSVIVTGDGDCLDIRRIMIEGGVPPAAIRTECQSRNTWENAELSAPMIEAEGANRAVLVTSWFHTRRAIGCFTAALPGVEWISRPVEPPSSMFARFGTIDALSVLQEYVKIAWYVVRHGIDPFDVAAPRDGGYMAPSDGEEDRGAVFRLAWSDRP